MRARLTVLLTRGRGRQQLERAHRPSLTPFSTTSSRALASARGSPSVRTGPPHDSFRLRTSSVALPPTLLQPHPPPSGQHDLRDLRARSPPVSWPLRTPSRSAAQRTDPLLARTAPISRRRSRSVVSRWERCAVDQKRCVRARLGDRKSVV